MSKAQPNVGMLNNKKTLKRCDVTDYFVYLQRMGVCVWHASDATAETTNHKSLSFRLQLIYETANVAQRW